MPVWMNNPIVSSAFQIVIIFILVILSVMILRTFIRMIIRRLDGDSERRARLKTLIQAGQGLMLTFILILAALMILTVLGFNIVPLLAGAGVVGLALSLGAQALVKDIINGILILVENQFSVGDVIEIGSHAGNVERITLRATCLRDADGKLHIIPNGEIRAVTNATAGWSLAAADLFFGFQEDMTMVNQALQAAAERAKSDPTIKDVLLETPAAQGWLGFNEWSIHVRLAAKTKPGKHWAVASELRRLALEELSKSNIRMAIPRQEIEIQK